MSKKITKFSSLLLVFMLLLTILIGCSQSQDASKETDSTSETDSTDVKQSEESQVEEPVEETYDFGGRTITYAAWWNLEPVAGSSEGADKALARLAEMQEKYNFTVSFINVPFDQILEQFTASTLAGDPFADIAWVTNHWFFPGLVANGFLLPVEDLGVFDFSEDKWNDGIIEASKYKGKIYGLATGGPEVRTGMYFNKAIFEREGLPNLYELMVNKEWTWDKMLEIALKATKDLNGDGTIDQWGLNSNLEWPLIYSNNAEGVRIIDGKPVFALTEANAIEAFQFWQDLILVHKVCDIPPDGASWDYYIQQFQDGKTAMCAAQWWVTERFSPNMADDYGFVLFPMGPKADDYVMHTDEVVFPVIPSAVKKPEEVAVFYDKYTDPFPDDEEDPDGWKESFLSNARDMETVDITMQMLKDKNYLKISWWRSFSELEQLGWNTFWKISTGNQTPQVTMEEMAPQAQAILDDALTRQ